MQIDTTLYSGRPQDERSENEMRCYELLDSLGIEYMRVDHEFAHTIEVCHEVEKVLGAEICKNLLLTNRQMTEVYLLLMPGDKPFKTKILSRQIGTARLSFASEEQMQSLLGVTPGSVTVLGLMNDAGKKVHLLIDSDLTKAEYFGCHPCINSSTLRIGTADVLNKLVPALGHEPTFVELPWVIED